jgi:hypothetical protein
MGKNCLRQFRVRHATFASKHLVIDRHRVCLPRLNFNGLRGRLFLFLREKVGMRGVPSLLGAPAQNATDKLALFHGGRRLRADAVDTKLALP